jgi:cation diffusion facilitator CzcD-associated flavoprotein CzcO
VACTGFEAAEIGAPFPITGLDGRDLDREWRDGQSAYLGTSVSGFPNLFIMTGPNTALGHNSMVYMIEAQSHYVVDAIAQLAQRPGSALDVDAQAQRRYNEKLQSRLARTVWNTGGCRSWYLARNGQNTTLWPDFTFVFRYKLRRFDERPYRWLA